MNRQAIDLGFILRQIPGFDFSMEEFEDRLKLQKTVYLLQSFDIYLGYDFSWYLRGPYCPVLTTKGFALQESYSEIPNIPVKFQSTETQERFEKFKEFVRDKGVNDLEIAASLHYLKKTETTPDEKIKEKVVNKQEEFTSDQINRIWDEMTRCELI